MERPIFKPIGTPTEELDTPTLVVDLDALAHNIEAVHSFFREREAKLRPHVEAHGCPGIAHRQLASAGTVGGVSVSTVGEAEVFAQAGISDITVANEVVTSQKIARLCALARSSRVTVAVDNPRVVERTSRAAQDAGRRPRRPGGRPHAPRALRRRTGRACRGPRTPGARGGRLTLRRAYDLRGRDTD